MTKQEKKRKEWIDYYNQTNILDEIIEEPIELSLDEQLRQNILLGKNRRKLKNITIKIDPIQIKAIRKLATMKSMPYQTLIRNWLAKEIKEELRLVR